MTTCAIYLRVSSDRQAQEGDSIAAQRDAIRTYIDDRADLFCVGEYVDDGVSGTKVNRDELSRLLDDVRAGKVKRILFTKLDRWFRSIRHYIATQEILDKYGVDWTAIWEPIYDTTTPQGRLIVNQMMSIAQFEAENTGQRIRQVMEYKIKQGEAVTGVCPIGYSIVNKRLTPNEDAPIVLDIFKFYDMNGSLNAVTKYARDVHGVDHTKHAWKLALKNTKYIGVWKGNENYCEPIVPRELFDAVNEKLSKNIRMNKKREYIFCGLIVCPQCGRKYASCFNRGNPRYRCARRYNGSGKCSNSVSVSERAVEQYLLENVRELLKGRELEYQIEQKKQADHSAQIKKLQTKRDRLKELYLNELIGLDEYKADREALDADIAALRARRAPEAIKPIDLPKDFETLYNGFTALEKRYLWRSVIKEIRVNADRSLDVIFL